MICRLTFEQATLSLQLKATVINFGKVDRRSATGIRQETMVMNEICFSDGQRILFGYYHGSEMEAAQEDFNYEKVTHILHAATILIVSLLLRKTSVLWQDGFGLEIRWYDEGGQLILGPNPWTVVLMKLLMALVLAAAMILMALFRIFRMIYSLDTHTMIMIIMLYDILQIYNYFFN